ncbi:MAG: TlpA disulfide reductase family protein [bacterium]|jgi:peroxiredoxin
MNYFRFVALVGVALLMSGAAVAAEKKAPQKSPAVSEKPQAAPVAAPQAPPAPVKVGEIAGNFTLKDVDSKEKELSSLKGNAPYTVLTFTNSVCSACRDEMSMLAKVWQKNKEKLQLVAIFTDASTDVGAKATKEMYKDAFVCLMDPAFTIPPAFGFEYTPAMVLIDKSGKVLYSKGGYNKGMGEQTSKEIVSFLK